MDSNTNILRLATYMCPDIPVEYYEFLAEYLETQLKLQTVLIYNSRKHGPDTSRGDHQLIDLGMAEEQSSRMFVTALLDLSFRFLW